MFYVVTYLILRIMKQNGFHLVSVIPPVRMIVMVVVAYYNYSQIC